MRYLSDMRTQVVKQAAFLLAAALISVPAVAPAATAQASNPVKITYQTQMQDLRGPSAPWSGSLELTIYPDGIIQGYYHPADSFTAFIPVTGGRNGNHVWLDIGRNGRLHVDGTIANGEIVGSAFDQSTLEAYRFSANA